MLALALFAAAALPPLGPWQVESRPVSCVLSRDFGEPGRPTSLRFELTGAGRTVVDVAFERREGGFGSGNGSVTFGSPGRRFDSSFFGGSGFTFPHRLSARMSLTGSTLVEAGAAGVNTVTIRVMGRTAVAAVQTGPGFATLLHCRDLLWKSWGLDPAAIVPAPTLVGAWFKPSDYPPTRAMGRPGSTSLRWSRSPQTASRRAAAPS